ncbi:hypothetical protein L3Q82_020892 [Scortum barcoo]|uniref:Uncharacterized protein n=1 Tax=Scortum barcoo TaxID=214431 RepID=A0ACB8VC46_9TELE|nr:hypothetical protein L3Q82_020892 [Scortum barcoo]
MGNIGSLLRQHRPLLRAPQGEQLIPAVNNGAVAPPAFELMTTHHNGRYEDKEFGNQFFSVISTADLHDKATMGKKKLLITHNICPLDESALSTTLSSVDTGPADNSEVDPVDDGEVDPSPADDGTSSSSNNSSLLPA